MSRLAWGLPLLAALVLLALATPADAAVTGPCTGTINGHEIHGRVTVPENGTVPWQFTSTGGLIESWTVSLVFLGQSLPISEGEDEEPDKVTIGDSANVSKYAWAGGGAYGLTGTVNTEAGPCTGTVEILVEVNPLTTLIGGLGAGAAVVGAGGAAAAGAFGAKSALAAALKP